MYARTCERNCILVGNYFNRRARICNWSVLDFWRFSKSLFAVHGHSKPAVLQRILFQSVSDHSLLSFCSQRVWRILFLPSNPCFHGTKQLLHATARYHSFSLDFFHSCLWSCYQFFYGQSAYCKLFIPAPNKCNKQGTNG